MSENVLEDLTKKQKVNSSKISYSNQKIKTLRDERAGLGPQLAELKNKLIEEAKKSKDLTKKCFDCLKSRKGFSSERTAVLKELRALRAKKKAEKDSKAVANFEEKLTSIKLSSLQCTKEILIILGQRKEIGAIRKQLGIDRRKLIDKKWEIKDSIGELTKQIDVLQKENKQFAAQKKLEKGNKSIKNESA